MKLTRNELKGIVKECLIEIFSDSFNLSESNTQRPEKRQENTNRGINERKFVQQRQQFRGVIKTGDPILDSVMADTARTTLPTMLEAEAKRPGSAGALPPGGMAERVVAASEPENLFGEEAAAKWAALAFNDFSKKS